MICTNPDLIVDRGNIRELCAGSVAMVFEKMGGEVIYFGKPHAEVYNQSIDNVGKKVLAIGDNLNTDIKGANLLNYHSLLVCCLLYTSPSPRDATLSRMPSSA